MMDQMNQTWVESKETAAQPQPGMAPMPYIMQAPPKREDTIWTKRMKEKFSFFGPVTALYAVFYAFCMFKNGSGVTFPFFVAASLLLLYFSLVKLEITLKKGSAFYMVSMMLLAISTFCTDDGRLIAFNKTGIFLLMMSLLLKQFYDTSNWKLGKYLSSIFMLVFAGLGEIDRPFADAKGYFKNKQGRQNRTLWYALLGVLIAVPLLAIVLALLAGADAVFRQVTDSLLAGINMGNIFNVVVQVTFIFFASYMLTSYLCKHTLKEQVSDKRKGEPVVAITITGLLSVVYLLFSVIQIVYLFLRQMKLPAGYTYAEYAREGFFQLLAVSILNLVIVLVCMSFFKESRVLKVVLTIMSFCTFIMIASSALRMVIYIRYYYLTFLRILVLWALAVLFLLFAGVVSSIYFNRFPLFGYSTVVVTVLYMMFSFAHPDLIIAAVNVANAPGQSEESMSVSGFFLSEGSYRDYHYLSRLSADAAPVLIPYLAEFGDDSEGFDLYMQRVRRSAEHLNIRTFNVSRYMALRQIERYAPTR